MIVHSKMPLAIAERHGAHQERKKGMTGAPHIGVRVGADGVGRGEKGKGEQALYRCHCGQWIVADALHMSSHAHAFVSERKLT